MSTVESRTGGEPERVASRVPGLGMRIGATACLVAALMGLIAMRRSRAREAAAEPASPTAA